MLDVYFYQQTALAVAGNYAEKNLNSHRRIPGRDNRYKVFLGGPESEQ